VKENDTDKNSCLLSFLPEAFQKSKAHFYVTVAISFLMNVSYF